MGFSTASMEIEIKRRGLLSSPSSLIEEIFSVRFYYLYLGNAMVTGGCKPSAGLICLKVI